MSDDFITRLGRQLEAAELRELHRSRALRRFAGARRLLWLPLAAAATIAVAALVVVALPGLGREAALGPGSVHEELSYRVLDDDAEHAAQVLRARFAAAGVPATTVSVPARDRLTISAPAAARAAVTALTRPGVLEIYDYERDGPAEGLVAPTTRADAEANAASFTNGHLVHDQRGGDRWYAFFGRPAVTNEDLASASSGVDERTGEPIVEIEFTPRGQRAFEALTRGIAHRGRRNVQPHPGEHFVIVLDGRILAPPQPVNPKVTPDGLDGSRGVQISGGLTSPSARRIATILNAWPMTAMVRTDEAGGG